MKSSLLTDLHEVDKVRVILDKGRYGNWLDYFLADLVIDEVFEWSPMFGGSDDRREILGPSLEGSGAGILIGVPRYGLELKPVE